MEIPKYNVTIRGNKAGARRIMGDPQLHVGAVGGVAYV
jgi:hypothetical protein